MLLEIDGLSFSFNREKQIFKDLDLQIEMGSIYVLNGENGSGKTTLLNLISGFLRPQKGTIKFTGRELNRMRPHQVNRIGIGRTFQDTRLIGKLTVKENLLLAMPGVNKKWIRTSLNHRAQLSADQLVERFYLAEVKDTNASSLSYGQQKLLNLACCVINGAMLLLLDEPVAGINFYYFDQISTLVRELKDEGKSFIIIEHTTEFVTNIADKYLHLSDGSIHIIS